MSRVRTDLSGGKEGEWRRMGGDRGRLPNGSLPAETRLDAHGPTVSRHFSFSETRIQLTCVSFLTGETSLKITALSGVPQSCLNMPKKGGMWTS